MNIKISDRTKSIAIFILAIFSFNSMEAMVKSLPGGFSIWNILFFRYFFGVAFLIPFLFKRFKLPDRASFRLSMIRGLLALSSAGCFFAAVRLIPLAQASVLIFCSPVFSQILSHFILKELMAKYTWFALVLGVSGIATIFISAWVPHVNLVAEFAGMTLALSSALIFSLMLIVSKIQVNNQVNTAKGNDYVPLVIQSLTGLIIISPFSINHLPVIVLPVMIKLIFIGFLGTAGLILLSLSFRRSAMNHVSIYQFTGVIWAGLYGYILFEEVPSVLVLIGMILIFLSMIWMEFAMPLLNKYESRKNATTIQSENVNQP